MRSTSSTGRFVRDGSGNFAATFGVALLPMLMLGGMGIDYGVNVAARTQAQNAVDATSLTLAKLKTNVSDNDLQTKAEGQVKALLADRRIVDPVVTATRNGDEIKVSLAATTPTSLTSVMGYRSLPLHVESTTRRGSGNLEIALVLDNTGSMEGAKLANLKAAATDLVNSMFAEVDPAKPNSLKMAVVPFSMTVNIGSAYAGSSFMDVDAKSSVHKEIFADKSSAANRFTLLSKMNRTWGGCVESRPAPYDVQDTAPSIASPDTLFVPFFAPDESDNDDNAVNDYMNDYPSFTWSTSNDNRTRQGQIDKYGKNKFKVGTTDRQGGTGYLYGPNSGCELTPLTRLTTGKSTLLDAISAMKIKGDTNIALGLAWGWHAVSPGAPFADGVAYTDTKTRKYVVLMTDGANSSAYSYSSNQSYYSGIGFIWGNRIGTTSSDKARRTAAMDARTEQVCTNMKNAGIQVFTVRVEVDEGTSDLLRNCASSPSMFYDVKNSSNLTAVFRSIGSAISELRISK